MNIFEEGCRIPSCDERKCIEAVCYAKKNAGREIDLPEYSFIVYLSDKYHLEKYGISIYREQYINLNPGPLALNAAYVFNKEYGEPDLRFLSESEQEALNHSLEYWNERQGTEYRGEFFSDMAKIQKKFYDVISYFDIARTLPNSEEVLDHLSG